MASKQFNYKNWLIGAVLAFVGMAIYSPSIGYDYVYDDDAVIKENRFVKEGLDGLGKIWTTSYFRGYDETMNARAYRPAPLTTLAAEVEFFGLNPTANHAFNVLFYGLTGLFLYLFLSKLLRDFHPALPIFTCLLFLLHPIHVEVVANIKSRDTMLGFLGFCISAWLLLKHLDSRRWLPLALSVVFFFIGLFSKEEVLTTVAVIPLMLWFFRKYGMGKIAFATLPFVGAAVIYLVIRTSVIGGLNEGVPLTEFDNSLLGAKNFGERSASTILVLGHFLLKTVFPHPLISSYSWLTLPLVNWDDWRVYLSLLASSGLLAVGIIGLKNRKLYGFATLYYFCTVSIFTSILVHNVSAYDERFLYSPVLGVCLLAAWLILKLGKTGEEKPATAALFFKLNFVPVAILALLCSASFFKIMSRMPYWKDRYALFQEDARQAPNNAQLRKNHGGSLSRLAVQYQKENPDLARQYATQAVQELEAALSIYPKMPTGHIHLGISRLILHDFEGAEQSLKTALEQDPSNHFAKVNLAQVYYQKGRYQEGIALLESVDRQYRSQNAYYLLSLLYERIGDVNKTQEYRQLSGR